MIQRLILGCLTFAILTSVVPTAEAGWGRHYYHRYYHHYPYYAAQPMVYQPGAMTYAPGAMTYAPTAMTYQPAAMTYAPSAMTYQPANMVQPQNQVQPGQFSLGSAIRWMPVVMGALGRTTGGTTGGTTSGGAVGGDVQKAIDGLEQRLKERITQLEKNVDENAEERFQELGKGLEAIEKKQKEIEQLIQQWKPEQAAVAPVPGALMADDAAAGSAGQPADAVSVAQSSISKSRAQLHSIEQKLARIKTGDAGNIFRQLTLLKQDRAYAVADIVESQARLQLLASQRGVNLDEFASQLKTIEQRLQAIDLNQVQITVTIP